MAFGSVDLHHPHSRDRDSGASHYEGSNPSIELTEAMSFLKKLTKEFEGLSSSFSDKKDEREEYRGSRGQFVDRRTALTRPCGPSYRFDERLFLSQLHGLSCAN